MITHDAVCTHHQVFSAVGMLDEEISLMQEPMEEEVIEAREEIVRPLREANEAGTLRIEK